MTRTKRTVRSGKIIALAIALAAIAGSGVAQDRASGCKSGQDCALGAVQSGAVRPLSEVLAVARAKVPGEVVKIELERENGIWVYEIKILTPAGKRREVEINASTLAIIKVD